MRDCVCNNCGLEFQVNKLDVITDTLKDGHEVEVISFICPKCDERYIIAVRDEESGRMQKEVQAAKSAYKGSYKANDPESEERMRKTKKEVDFKRRQQAVYMRKLKKRYLKELRKRGQ